MKLENKTRSHQGPRQITKLQSRGCSQGRTHSSRKPSPILETACKKQVPRGKGAAAGREMLKVDTDWGQQVQWDTLFVGGAVDPNRLPHLFGTNSGLEHSLVCRWKTSRSYNKNDFFHFQSHFSISSLILFTIIKGIIIHLPDCLNYWHGCDAKK